MKKMKNFRLLPVTAFVAVGLIFASCEKDQDDIAPVTSPKSNSGQFESTFSGACFVVTNFIEEGQNETSDYNNLELSFAANGTITASKGPQSASGVWSQTVNNGQQKLNIFFQNVPGILLELNEDWNIQSAVDGTVSLVDVDGPFTNILVLGEVECGSVVDGGGGGSPALAAFNAVLQVDSWVASTFILKGQNRINSLNNVVFTFNNSNVVTLVRNNTMKNGAYLSRVDDGVLEVLMNFTAPPSNVTALNEDWKVISYDDNEIQLADPFDNGNPNSFLTLVRN